MERHRIPIIVGTAVVSLGGLPLLYFLQFDFNPMNLRSPKVESVATFLDLRSDPNTGANAIDVLRARSRATRARLRSGCRKVPEVTQVMTLDIFVPADQEQKLAYDPRRRQGARSGVQAPTRARPRPTRRTSRR